MKSVDNYKLWIDGHEVEAEGGEYFAVIDPGCGEEIGLAARGKSADIDRAVFSAHKAFYSQDWYGLKPYERGRLMLKLAEKINSERDHLAKLLSLENGNTLRESYEEVGQ